MIASEKAGNGDEVFKDVSNTFGNETDFGFKGNVREQKFKVRIGAESDADYTDGNNDRIRNSCFDGLMQKQDMVFAFTNGTL